MELNFSCNFPNESKENIELYVQKFFSVIPAKLRSFYQVPIEFKYQKPPVGLGNASGQFDLETNQIKVFNLEADLFKTVIHELLHYLDFQLATQLDLRRKGFFYHVKDSKHGRIVYNVVSDSQFYKTRLICNGAPVPEKSYFEQSSEVYAR